MATSNASAAQAKDAAPRARAGTPPVDPTAAADRATSSADGDTAVAEKTETPAAGENQGVTYVTHQDLDTFAERILKGFEDRMAKRSLSEARDRPVHIRQGVDVGEPQGPERHRDIPTDAFEMAMLERPDLIVEHNPDVEDAAELARKGVEAHAEMMAFLKQRVLINVAESTNPNEQPVIPLTHNGNSIYITRGQDTWVRRYYVEILLRAKPADYDIRVVRNGNGDVVNRATRKSAMAYPFTVITDTPQGRAWLRELQREG